MSESTRMGEEKTISTKSSQLGLNIPPFKSSTKPVVNQQCYAPQKKDNKVCDTMSENKGNPNLSIKTGLIVVDEYTLVNPSGSGPDNCNTSQKNDGANSFSDVVQIVDETGVDGLRNSVFPVDPSSLSKN